MPLTSVVIPVKNGCGTIGACLEGILAQNLRDHLEIIVIDSGSTDGTLELLARYPVKVHQISPEEFNHGETRNLGARLAQGQFVAMTVQDARPVDDRWLERMLRHFDDSQVAGVCGQQVVPHEPDKNPLQWFRPYSEPVPRKLRFSKPAEFQVLSPAEQVALCGWDDVNAVYRRSVLLEMPFKAVSFAEDLIWAKDALLRGHALVYDYNSKVYHYHHETFRFRFRRHHTVQYHMRRYFGYVPKPSWLLPDLARSLYRASRRKYCPERRASWLLYNLKLNLAGWLSGWCFWLAARVGGNYAVEQAHASVSPAPPQAARPQ